MDNSSGRDLSQSTSFLWFDMLAQMPFILYRLDMLRSQIKSQILTKKNKIPIPSDRVNGLVCGLTVILDMTETPPGFPTQLPYQD